MTRNKVFISLAALGLAVGVALAAGLGVRGASDSGDSLTTGSESLAIAPTLIATPEASGTARLGLGAAAKLDKGPTSTPNPGPELSVAATPKPALEPELPGDPASGSVIAPDPDFRAELRAAGISTGGWTTDFSRHTIPFAEIFSGGVPRDGIPSIDNPKFTGAEDAAEWLGDEEPVIAFEINQDARAYPLKILTQHEIVNDLVGGVPVAVTFCPLCNSAIVFDRRLDGTVHDFGVSGNLRKSDLIMYDRQTHSWWQQLTGDGVVGELAGKKLTFLPAAIVSWGDFKASAPQGKVLSRDTGFGRNYNRLPYAGYDRADNPPFLFRGDLDGRLLPKERVAAVTIGDVDAAFPFSTLGKERAVNYTVGGQDLVVFFKPGTRSVFVDLLVGGPAEVGATGVFDAILNGRKLTFQADGDKFVDNETRSVWTILGEAVDGPLAGKKLTPIVHTNSFWFAVAAFKPDSKIYQGAE